MDESHFTIPMWVDLVAVFIGALAGVSVAARQGFDIIGAITLALVSGLGGAILRDGIFLQHPPVVARDDLYVIVAVGTAVFAPLFFRLRAYMARTLDWMDAVAIGLYGMIGTEAAIRAGMSHSAAVCVGAVNAIGGGLIRDLLCQEKSAVFKPGTFYTAAVIAGSALFVFLNTECGWSFREAGIAGFLVTLGVRTAAVIFDIRTTPVSQPEA